MLAAAGCSPVLTGSNRREEGPDRAASGVDDLQGRASSWSGHAVKPGGGGWRRSPGLAAGRPPCAVRRAADAADRDSARRAWRMAGRWSGGGRTGNGRRRLWRGRAVLEKKNRA